jgi:hypothetical protein
LPSTLTSPQPPPQQEEQQGEGEELKRLTNDLTSLQNEIKTLSQRNYFLENEQRRHQETAAVINHLNHTTRSLTATIHSKDLEVQESIGKLHSLTEKYEELSIRYTSSQTENLSLRNALRKVNGEMECVVKENNKYEDSVEEFRRMSQLHEVSLEEKERELRELRHENEKLKSSLAAVAIGREEKMRAKREGRGDGSPVEGRGTEGGAGSSSSREGGPSSAFSPMRRVEWSEDHKDTSSLSPELSGSPNKPFRAARTSGAHAGPAGLMSRSAPLPSIALSDPADQDHAVAQHPRSKRRTGGGHGSPPHGQQQQYYKGVPIEELTSRPQRGSHGHEEDSVDQKFSPSKRFSVPTAATAPSSSASLVVYPADNPVMVGLDGMKHMRNLNSQEYHRHTQHYLQTSSSSPSATILKPLSNAPVVNSSQDNSDAALGPTGGNRLPSISKDTNSNSRPSLAAPALATAPLPLSLSASDKKKSLQEKNQMIQKIIADSALRRSQMQSTTGIHQAMTGEEEFSENYPVLRLKFLSSAGSEEDESERRGQRQKGQQQKQKQKQQRGSSKSKDKKKTDAYPAATKTRGAERSDQSDHQDQRPTEGSKSPSPPRGRKKHHSSTRDSLHLKAPCSMCGMHFSGEGMKLPHSHPQPSAPSSLLMRSLSGGGENHSQASSSSGP